MLATGSFYSCLTVASFVTFCRYCWTARESIAKLPLLIFSPEAPPSQRSSTARPTSCISTSSLILACLQLDSGWNTKVSHLAISGPNSPLVHGLILLLPQLERFLCGFFPLIIRVLFCFGEHIFVCFQRCLWPAVLSPWFRWMASRLGSVSRWIMLCLSCVSQDILCR